MSGLEEIASAVECECEICDGAGRIATFCVFCNGLGDYDPSPWPCYACKGEGEVERCCPACDDRLARAALRSRLVREECLTGAALEERLKRELEGDEEQQPASRWNDDL